MTGHITEAKYLELRKEKVLPLFEDFHKWLLEKGEREEILESSKTAERAIKPFVMARKNSYHGILKLHHSNFVANGWS